MSASLPWLLWLAFAFFCGSLPFSVWLARFSHKRDPRAVGNHNPGATNALKAGGKGLGLAVLLFDVSKAAFPVGLAYQVFGLRGLGMALISLAPLLGHAFSPWLGFRGGKAIACALGAWIGLTLWKVPLVALSGITLWFWVFKKAGWAVFFTLTGIGLYLFFLRPEPLLFEALGLQSLLLFSGTAILNALTFPRLKPASPTRLSVLLPMRNEAQTIGETICLLLAQDYPNLEILLLDDHSSDQSAKIARKTARGDSRVRILRGAPRLAWQSVGLPAVGRTGQREYLLFTDVDVHWQPGSLSALLAESQRSEADLLTVWPTQQTQTWGERLTVPLMAFAVLAYLPVLAVHYLPGRCLPPPWGNACSFGARLTKKLMDMPPFAGKFWTIWLSLRLSKAPICVCAWPMPMA